VPRMRSHRAFSNTKRLNRILDVVKQKPKGSERPRNYRTEKLVTVLRPEPELSRATSAGPFARGLNLLPTLDVYRRSCQATHDQTKT
jgi:hypothetical protein